MGFTMRKKTNLKLNTSWNSFPECTSHNPPLRPCGHSCSSTSACPSSSAPWPATFVRAFVHVLPTLGPGPCFALRTQPRGGQKGESKPASLQLSYSQNQAFNTGPQMSPFQNRILARHLPRPLKCFLLFVFYSPKINAPWPSV